MNVDEGDATEATGTCHERLRLSALSREPLDAVPVNVRAIRGHSTGSLAMTALFEESFDTIARFTGAPGRASVAYLAFSFHKMLAPFGVGVLYARQRLAESSLRFPCGGDMIAEGRVLPEYVEYNSLPWKYAAGTPNILGTIASAQALRILLDLALTPRNPAYFCTSGPVERLAVRTAMARVSGWNHQLTLRALDGLGAIPGLTIYGPRDASLRTSPVAFHIAGRDPVSLAECLNRAGVEARAGCHSATLAHHSLKLTPPAGCRLSFYLYNTPEEVDRAVAAVAAIAAHRYAPKALWYRPWSWQLGRSPGHVPIPARSS